MLSSPHSTAQRRRGAKQVGCGRDKRAREPLVPPVRAGGRRFDWFVGLAERVAALDTSDARYTTHGANRPATASDAVLRAANQPISYPHKAVRPAAIRSTVA